MLRFSIFNLIKCSTSNREKISIATNAQFGTFNRALKSFVWRFFANDENVNLCYFLSNSISLAFVVSKTMAKWLNKVKSVV